MASRSTRAKHRPNTRTRAKEIMLAALRGDHQGVTLLIATTPTLDQQRVAAEAIAGLAAAIRTATPAAAAAITEAVHNLPDTRQRT